MDDKIMFRTEKVRKEPNLIENFLVNVDLENCTISKIKIENLITEKEIEKGIIDEYLLTPSIYDRRTYLFENKNFKRPIIMTFKQVLKYFRNTSCAMQILNACRNMANDELAVFELRTDMDVLRMTLVDISSL